MEGSRTGTKSDGESCAAVVGQARLEPFHRRTGRQPITGEDRRDGL